MPGLFVALAVFGVIAFALTGALVPPHTVNTNPGERWRISGKFSPPIPASQQANFESAFTSTLSALGGTSVSDFNISSDSFAVTVLCATPATLQIGTPISVGPLSMTLTSAVRAS